MKRRITQILLAVWLGFLVPGILLSVMSRRPPIQEAQTNSSSQQTEVQSAPTEQTQLSKEFSIPVLLPDNSIQQMELDTYLTCVVLAEMPAEFEMEALKAQAVVARTYALKRYVSGGKHSQGAVCTDPSCCQAYCTEESFLERGEPEQLLEKVRSAVTATHGQVLTYHGEFIEATYFSCSGGRTEDAAAVWGSDIPYLQAVDSPGEEDAEHYMETVSFKKSEFASLIGMEQSELTGDFLGSITYTAGGGVDTIQIGGQVFDGTTVRQRLGLYSTAFVITAVRDTVTITTKGYGHRVGMSQYGADAMAVQGSTYNQILAYYYNGTSLEYYEI